MSVLGKDAVRGNRLSFASAKFPKFSWSWVSIPSLLLAWGVSSLFFESYILPSPIDVWNRAAEWFGTGEIYPHIWTSFVEEVIGFGSAIVVALFFGFLAGFYKGFREYIVPLNGVFMSIPPIAWAPIMVIFFGIGIKAIVVVIFISAVNPMILSIMDGVLTIQGSEVRAARALGAKKKQLFWHVYLPASLPFITSALRIGFSQAWRALVAAEMIGGTAGFGVMVTEGSNVGSMSQVMLGVVLIGLVSWMFERLIFRQIEKRYEVWRLV